ncbi:MAG TPA: polyprenol monophosphomannose synthase [Chthoniobacterales bacterium]|jgi:dolichol-phosphate mannosyltransferase|nr:polyprenol monophosphomannose synthase [Chthoniobacterales bacterium]
MTTRSLIVVPTYNESGNISELIQKILANLPDVQLLVVDDDSSDRTADVVEKIAANHSGVKLIRRNGERGFGRALMAGIEYGLNNGFDVIGTMDADLSHDPAYLLPMLELLASHDVVIGSRYVRDGGTVNWGMHRVLLSWFANRFAAALLRIPARDITSGYRLYRRSALEWIRTTEIKSSGYSFLGELLYRAYRGGATIAECPIIFHDRTKGASKLGRREIYLGAINLIRLKFSRD